MFGVGLPEPLIIFTLVVVIFGAGKLAIATCLSKKIQNYERQVFLMV
jgi:Sec-independent protein translocase protein TatA